MEEYASAGLVALVQRALAVEGISTVAPRSGGALLPFQAKHRFLRDVAREHGLLPLLRAGSALSSDTSDPAVSALLSAVTPHDLFERWQRLERFTHSRHRVMVRERGAEHLVAEHVGPPGAPPDPAEDALVLGVLTALLALRGVRDIRVAAGRGAPVTVYSDGVFLAPPPPRDSALWRFGWSRTPLPADPRARVLGRDEISRTRRLLAADPARRWTLGRLSDELGIPPRSLQRRLADAGGFSGLLGRVRTETAAELLMRGDHPVSVIGFVCGYADQPHFTRHFKLRTAMTPAAYRSAFRRPAPGARRLLTPEPTKGTTP
ncbi:AraC family transcriptional regulator [Streptomyces sp. CAU 1734]|uniref:helix-turn-helix transcriptional regulator n=1 Tax=Streptomyces sp. CAU 1734 TaxID=3140360 RepID=UPI003260E653